MSSAPASKFRLSPEGWWLVNPMFNPIVPKSKRGDWEKFWVDTPHVVLSIRDCRGGDPGDRVCALIHVGGMICWADIITGALYCARRCIGLTTPTRIFSKPAGKFKPARRGPVSAAQARREAA